MKVLLLESDKVLAAALALFFKKADIKLKAVADAQAAIIETDTNQPDAIILELLLVNRSGAEFLYELRSYPDWQKIPVIIYTSLPANEVATKSGCFKQLDVKHYFYKPTTKLADLLDAVRDLSPAAV